jgi:hypothetical protein
MSKYISTTKDDGKIDIAHGTTSDIVKTINNRTRYLSNLNPDCEPNRNGINTIVAPFSTHA